MPRATACSRPFCVVVGKDVVEIVVVLFCNNVVSSWGEPPFGTPPFRGFFPLDVLHIPPYPCTMFSNRIPAFHQETDQESALRAADGGVEDHGR